MKIKNFNQFNEELDYKTYMSASDKLDSKGHNKRAEELKNWAEKNAKKFTFYFQCDGFGNGNRIYEISGYVTSADSHEEVKLTNPSSDIPMNIKGVIPITFNPLKLNSGINMYIEGLGIYRVFLNNRKDAVILKKKLKEYTGVDSNVNDLYTDIEE